MGLAGATVCRGVMGFGKQSVIHKGHFLGLSDDLPERVEIIERPDEIERLLPALDGHGPGGPHRGRRRACHSLFAWRGAQRRSAVSSQHQTWKRIRRRLGGPVGRSGK